VNAVAQRIGCTVVFAGAVALPAQQRAVVTICVPAATDARVGELLTDWYGAGVVLDAVATIPGPVAGEPRVWLLWDEWSLVRATGGPATSLPFLDDLVLVVQQGIFVEDERPPSWEAIAMMPSLHDRLGLVAPEVDGGPWLAAMQHRLERGLGEDAGIALWTTLDARAGRLQDSYAAMTRTLAVGGLAAAIGPRRLFVDLLARGPARLDVHALPGARLHLGVAASADAGPRALAIAAELATPERARALAAAAGLAVAEPAASGLSPARARSWWQRFETQVRGRGRGVEQLADWLDIVFGLGFLVCAWFVYRALRDSRELG
jgi:hypothetical protein